MAYKVIKKEFSKQRPKWVAKFLFCLSPKVFNVHETLDSARDNLRTIKKTLDDMSILKRFSRLRCLMQDDLLEIRTRNNNPVISFQINNNYS